MFTIERKDLRDAMDEKFAKMGTDLVNHERFLIGKQPNFKDAILYKQLSEAHCYGDCKIQNCLK